MAISGVQRSCARLFSSSTRWAAHRPATCQMPTLMDIGSRSLFDSDQDIFRENVRRFMRGELTVAQAVSEKEGMMRREVWKKLGDQGLLGVSIPAESGGIGGSWKEECIVLEEQAYAHCHAPAITVHSSIVIPYLAHYGTPDQVQKFVPDMVAGQKVGAIAMTEPDAGSDLQGIRTTAKQDGDWYTLNGSKVFITNGILADVVIVVAITNPSAKSTAHGISLFLVEDGMEGFHKGKNLNKMGMKGHDTAELFFENCRVPKENLLGGLNKGFYHLMQELPQERLAIGVSSLAAAEWMFEETRQYLMMRKAFGKTLSSLQTIQHRLAEMKTALVVCRAFVDQCIEMHDAKVLDSAMASMAKYWTTDLENKVAAECVQLHGGWGYMMATPIARSYVDARVQTIYGGSNEIMKELIARTIVQPPRPA